MLSDTTPLKKHKRRHAMNSLIGRRKEWKIKFPRAGDVKQVLTNLNFGGGNGKCRRCGFVPIPIVL